MNSGYGGRGGRYDGQQQEAYRPSDRDITEIIQSPDPVVSAEATVRCAKEFGKALARSLKASQIRNIFGTVRRIEMNWREDATVEEQKAAYRELLLLQPKLGYQSKRVEAVSPLAAVLTAAIQQVQGDRVRFQRFVDFFEAILAYHKAEGGKE